MAAVLESLSNAPVADDDLAEPARRRVVPPGGASAMAASGRARQPAWRDWAWALAPVVLVVAGVLLFFRGAFVHAITTMPGSEVVQVIVVAFLVGVVLACLALKRYRADDDLMWRWRAAPAGPARERVLDAWAQASWVLSVLRALGSDQAAALERQARLESELSALRERLAARMTAPNYLAGTLIGLGLVGTFMGLIATLGDLGRLFESLMGSSRPDVNPTDLFADMVRRLQEPMRGMGTAFVSSLFGLVASLLLGLTALTVGRVGGRLADDIAELVRHVEAERAQAWAAEEASSAATERETLALELKLRAEEWRRVLDDLLELQNRQERQALMMRGEIAEMAESTRTLVNALRERLRVDRAPGRTKLRQVVVSGRGRAGRIGGDWGPLPNLDSGRELKHFTEATVAHGERLAAEFSRVSQEQTGLMWGMSQNLEHLSELLDATLSRQVSFTLSLDPTRKTES
jgi:hypothetical protein